MVKRVVKVGLVCVVLGILSANGSVIFSDDFSTDPFAAPARWEVTYTQNGSWSAPTWQSDTEDVKFRGDTGEMQTTSAFTLPVQQSGCYIQFQFKLTDTAGAYTGTKAMLQLTPGQQSDGYRIGTYTVGGGSTWISKDSRLTEVSYSGNTTLSTDVWYTMKVGMFDDTANDKTVVTIEVFDPSQQTVISGIYEDASDARLKTHTGMTVRVYPGNNHTGTYIDNVVAVPEPATVGLVTLGLGFLFRKK